MSKIIQWSLCFRLYFFCNKAVFARNSDVQYSFSQWKKLIQASSSFINKFRVQSLEFCCIFLAKAVVVVYWNKYAELKLKSTHIIGKQRLRPSEFKVVKIFSMHFCVINYIPPSGKPNFHTKSHIFFHSDIIVFIDFQVHEVTKNGQNSLNHQFLHLNSSGVVFCVLFFFFSRNKKSLMRFWFQRRLMKNCLNGARSFPRRSSPCRSFPRRIFPARSFPRWFFPR